MRPLISTTDAKSSVDISRKAELYETSSGMITITGGKLTTWRRMAKMTVDRIVERDALDAPCRTHEIPLGQADRAGRTAARRGRRRRGLRGARRPLRPRRRRACCAIAAERPQLAEPIVDGQPDLLAEAVWAARREQARELGDVLLRRTRLGLLAAREAAPPTTARARRGARSARSSVGMPRASAAEIEAFLAESAAEGIAVELVAA